MNLDAMKRQAAARALEFVSPNMKLGLGTGSTAAHFVDLLGAKVQMGWNVVGVPTSEATRLQAESLGIPLTTLDETPSLDLTVDGADEIDGDLTLIKGGGGALLREKIVAAASRSMIVIADETKWVDRLGRFALPIEVVPFGLRATLQAIEAEVPGKRCVVRKGRDGHSFVTDGGHLIVDVAMGEIREPATLAARLTSIPGVVETGLFVGMARAVVLASANGIRLIQRESL